MIEDLINKRKEILYHYSPVSFLNKGVDEQILKFTVIDKLIAETQNKDTQTYSVQLEGQTFVLLVKHLEWDSKYFEIPTFKLLAILYDPEYTFLLENAIEIFLTNYAQKGAYYYIEIPSEDIWTIQALNSNRFKLVENRLTYFLDLNKFSNERYPVRKGVVEDTENLKRVASEMVNIYDRFHADLSYNTTKADNFLATYIEESLKGFADYVIVPNAPELPADAFVTANYLKNEWTGIGKNISKMVLSAVSSKTCKGWYIKLISEMAYHLKEIGANYAYMHPATTNKAVIYSYEKLGCKYGKCIHILSLKA